MVYNETINFLTSHNQAIREWAIAVCTIILVYAAFLQVKASNRQINESRFQKRIEMHTDQLKEIIRVWETEISEFNLKIDKVIIYLPTEYKAEVENLPLFEDLKKHEPDDLDLFNYWSDFKNKILQWEIKKLNLSQRINDRISEKTELTFGMIPSDDNIFTEKLLINIYSQISNKIQNNKNIEPIHYDNIITENRGGEIWYSINTIVQSKQTENIEKLKQFTKELPTIVEDEGWLDEFQIIFDDYKQLINANKKKLLYKINAFHSVPLFSEECNYLKNDY